MESHASLQAKVSGFVPGVDMVDGKCDIETAHYFLQIFADGDVYTVRRTAISFVELDRDLMKRFPKLALPVLPIYSLAGASKLKKAKRSTTSDKFGKDVLVAVDDLMTLQPMLTSYICSLMAIEPVLACDEMRTFMTELSSEVHEKDDDDNRSTHEQKIKIIIERFGKGKGAEVLETVLMEGTPVTRHKLQPSMSHSVNLQVKEAGHFIVWGFTTLPGKSSAAKDVAFSMTYNGMPVRPYERYSKATTELCKGLWPCSAPGVATLTWHNDYSKWYSKKLAFKATVCSPNHVADAQKRLQRAESQRSEVQGQKNALQRALVQSAAEATVERSMDLFVDRQSESDYTDASLRSTISSSSSSGQPPLAQGQAHSSMVDTLTSLNSASVAPAPTHTTTSSSGSTSSNRRSSTGGNGFSNDNDEHGAPANTAEVMSLRREVAALQSALSELTAENTAQRAAVVELNANASVPGDVAVTELQNKVESSERLLVAQGQKVGDLQKLLAVEKARARAAVERAAALEARVAAREAHAASVAARSAVAQETIAKLKNDKKKLRCLAKQFREEASCASHELSLLRQTRASAKKALEAEKQPVSSGDSANHSTIEQLMAKASAPPPAPAAPRSYPLFAALAAKVTATQATAPSETLENKPQQEPSPSPTAPSQPSPPTTAAAKVPPPLPSPPAPSTAARPPPPPVPPAPSGVARPPPPPVPPPPSSASSTAAPSGAGSGSTVGEVNDSSEAASFQLWVARIAAFYQTYFPEKAVAKACRDTATKFKGREMDLFNALYHKYEVAPADQTYHSATPPGWEKLFA